uniref:Uncharacterized protein n=1 Tax=Anopheles stephensi TaxID=30069 RepID=A0A182YS81_ANOST
MESNFVSVFKLDGVPILPPLVNDEVRAAVAIYRQKAIEIEQRLQERKRTLEAIGTVDSRSIDGDSSVGKQGLDEKDGDLSGEKKELETITTSLEEDTSLQSEQSTITVPSGGLVPQEKIAIINTEATEKVDQANNDCNPIANQMKLDEVIYSSWQSSTRTVTPTLLNENSEESKEWFPLVRSNTFDLEKPSIDLVNLQRVEHSTPVIDRSKERSPDEVNERPKASRQQKILNPAVVTGKDSTPVKAFPAAIGKPKKSPKEKAIPSADVAKPRSKRRTATRKISHSSTGLERDRAFESVAQALTTHEQRMMELLKRQEEERLMLEESFRQKTQELVALCAKSLPVEDNSGMAVSANESGTMMLSASAVTRTKTPDMHTASSVSQLSLCDVSYDSCTDTDDAAYQTCHANGTSEENVNRSERTLTEDPSLGNDSIRTHSNGQDNNGNDVIRLLLPRRMTEVQQTRAATIINAYARGYLTRRLFQTDAVQNIKRTIADIVCFI